MSEAVGWCNKQLCCYLDQLGFNKQGVFQNLKRCDALLRVIGATPSDEIQHEVVDVFSIQSFKEGLARRGYPGANAPGRDNVLLVDSRTIHATGIGVTRL